jgi:exodeoxyribonuclease-5
MKVALTDDDANDSFFNRIGDDEFDPYDRYDTTEVEENDPFDDYCGPLIEENDPYLEDFGPVPTKKVELTAEQQKAILTMMMGIKKNPKSQQTLGGYAGTGKTTIISFMRDLLPNYHVCAYTGKAANVLRRKSVPATTIHSLIYEPVPVKGGVEFRLRTSLECSGIIVDESSMVSRDIYDDLISFNKPILFVGDHGQLEPVGSDYNLMQKPDITLEQIHRNSGEIAHFAEWLRHGRTSTSFKPKQNKVKFINKWSLGSTEVTNLICEVDQVICAFNKTRMEINERARAALGHKGIVVPGEKIMCLRNNRKLGLFNGMQGTVHKVWKKGNSHRLTFESNGTVYENISYVPDQFGKERTIEGLDRDGPNPFDYAYCITCHKSQGDEFGRTMVIEQKCKNWEHKRWTYTAASRAKDELWWVGA